MDKYGEMGDSLYCYPNSSILKNKLHIQDEKILEQAELELSEYASLHIEYTEPPYDLQYLKNIHYSLFSDLYEWAGELRQVDISKGDTRFCTFSRIEVEANKLFNNFNLKTIFNILKSKSLLCSLPIFIVNLMSFIPSAKVMDALSAFSLNIFSPIVVMVLIGLK
jgi:cell filamentation protein